MPNGQPGPHTPAHGSQCHTARGQVPSHGAPGRGLMLSGNVLCGFEAMFSFPASALPPDLCLNFLFLLLPRYLFYEFGEPQDPTLSVWPGCGHAGLCHSASDLRSAQACLLPASPLWPVLSNLLLLPQHAACLPAGPVPEARLCPVSHSAHPASCREKATGLPLEPPDSRDPPG